MEILETLKIKSEKALIAYNNSMEENEQILVARKREIEKAIASITEKYLPKLEEIEKRITENKQEIDNCHALMLKYSTFNAELIGHVIEELIKIIEGEDFKFQIAEHKISHLQYNIWSQPYESVVKKRVQLIVNAKKLRSEYYQSLHSESEITGLINTGNAILLGEAKYFDTDKIKFYDVKDNQIVCLANFGRFDYIKDFIDDVIEYRYANALEEISEAELVNLLQDFINSHQDIITRNYLLRAHTDISELLRQRTKQT